MNNIFEKILDLEKQGSYGEASFLHKKFADDAVINWGPGANSDFDFAQSYFEPVLRSYNSSIVLSKKCDSCVDVSFQKNAITVIQYYLFIDPTIDVISNVFHEVK